MICINRSKSRIRRLSEHIRKETVSSNSNPVIGQGDAIVGKNLTHSYQDLRKERGRSDAYEPSYVEGMLLFRNDLTVWI